MRIIRFVVALAGAVALLVPPSAQAGNTCVSYSVTAPVIGTKSGSPCVPTPFGQGITWYYCSGTPPIGEAHCVRVHAYLP